MHVSSLSCDSPGEAVDLQPSVATARSHTDANHNVTRQSLRSAALCQSGPRLCVDIPATHKWPSIGNPRSVDANAFDSVSTGPSLALTVAMSYHTDYTFRFSSSLALTNFSGVLMLDDRASSEKTSGASNMGNEDIVLSPQSHNHDNETRLSTSSKAYIINSSSADGRNPRPESLVIAAHGRDDDRWHVTSKHKHLHSTSHGIARCLRTRKASPLHTEMQMC